MTSNSLVKTQFNLQASNFDAWDTPKNLAYLKGFSDFLGLSETDTLLDVACGTGDFVVYCAPNVKKAVGVDISEKMIELSIEKQTRKNLSNVEFKVGDVEKLPFPDHSFSVVACKSAFHHMPEYKRVFSEMVRCCAPDGSIALCDIVAYDEPAVDRFFEAFEKLVDISHAKTLSKVEFSGFFTANNLRIDKTFELEIQHTVAEYLTHARQSKQGLRDLGKLLEKAKEIGGLSQYWNCLVGNLDKMTFRRKVFLILGKLNDL